MTTLNKNGTLNKDKEIKEIIDFFLEDSNDRDLRYDWSLKQMIKHNIWPTDIYEFIEDLIFWTDEPENKYDAIMNVWFSNRLALRHETYYQHKNRDIYV